MGIWTKISQFDPVQRTLSYYAIYMPRTVSISYHSFEAQHNESMERTTNHITVHSADAARLLK